MILVPLFDNEALLQWQTVRDLAVSASEDELRCWVLRAADDLLACHEHIDLLTAAWQEARAQARAAA